MGLSSRKLEIRISPFDPSRISIIATGRRYRPKHYASITENRVYPKTCPFCPGMEHTTPPAILVLTNGLEFKRDKGDMRVKDWLVRIFPNKYPALMREDKPISEISTYGYHEVIVETPIHNENIYLKYPSYTYYTLLALRRRMNEIMEDPYIKSIVVIKNRGPKAGASIVHPHLQLFANTFIQPVIESELKGFQQYLSRYKECPLCELVENIYEERLVLNSKYFIVYTRYAPKQSYELLVIPKIHRAYFTKVSDEELHDLAHVLSKLIRGLNIVLGDIDYNYWIHTAPKGTDEHLYHWHLEIQPLVETWGGYEKSSGVHIVTVSPEEAAKELREAIKTL